MDIAEIVASRARVEGDLIKVDDFLNHQVDPIVMKQTGSQIAGLLADRTVYAKKYVGPGNRYTFGREVVSPTKGVEYRVEVARHLFSPGLRIAIVDDFLAGGRTAEALGEIVEEANCEVVIFIFVIEKTYTEGRARLEAHNWTVESLVKIANISNGTITLV